MKGEYESMEIHANFIYTYKLYIFTYINYIYIYIYINYIYIYIGFPGGSDGKEIACNAGDPGSIPGERSSGEENDYTIQYSCLENSMDREAWRATVYGMAKSWSSLSDCHFHLLGFPGGTSGILLYIWRQS